MGHHFKADVEICIVIGTLYRYVNVELNIMEMNRILRKIYDAQTCKKLRSCKKLRENKNKNES